ncbi:MAG: D-alanyl-D-alanine carboxypeptidase [Methylobacterium mesophilicum]|nr:D-alanyl-D-alanine carboxypeptidase [Methylobacterium mesophilicum]
MVAASLIGAGAAEAAPRKAAAANPRYAAIVVDANTGKTLFSENPDAERFPASLTKMMTLYMTFEAMKAGRINKNTPVVFSAQAAAKPPTKIGVPAGKSVSVETAILSLVTKSANDAAAALGETLGGSEERFAEMMTQKARRLGMSSTVFRNASGLPNMEQHTTARDMATLGLALRAHFPEYYDYFSTPSFTLGRQRMPNHNKLLGRIKGVDGIKTGYTNASGFNLVSSVVDGNRKIVAVVMGGATGRSRDDQMARLIAKYLPEASAKGGTLVASASNTPLKAFAEAVLPKTDIPTPQPRREIVVASAAEADDIGSMIETNVVTTPKSGRVVRSQGYAIPKNVPTPLAFVRENPSAAAARIDQIATASVAQPGWVIQVASSASEREARALLDATSAKAPGVLDQASPFTVPFTKGSTTYYRARYSGFETKTAAWDACAALKKQRVSCYAIEQ